MKLRTRVVAALATGVLAFSLGVAAAPAANAGSLTQTCNPGAWSLAYGISKDNRSTYVPLAGGSCVWGTTHIRVQPGHCVYVGPHGRTYRAIYGSAVWVQTNWQGRGDAWRVTC